jgi:alkylation response protein AidB-like acyl-CoA dehydrogenase
MVPRGTPGVRYEPVIDKMGQRLNQNCDVVFENCRVPVENAFAIDNADLIVSKAFTWSGPVAGIAAVGTARSAYEYTLNWCKTYTAGGTDPIIYHQNVGYMLTDIAMRIEACRYLCWKAAHYLDLYDSEGHAIGAMAKVYASDVCTQVVYDCMRVMGVNSYDRGAHPLDKYMRDVLCFPIYDAGNMGMQRRKIWGVMASREFKPSAFVDCDPIRFTKKMEGLGTVTEVPELVGASR